MKRTTVFIVLGIAPCALAQPAWFMPVGDLPGGYFFSDCRGISADGQTAVGGSAINNALSSEGAFAWRRGLGLSYLGDLEGGAEQSGAQAISPDGSVAVGYGSPATAGTVAVLYDLLTGGMTNLGDLPGDSQAGIAYAVSNKGRVVVGKGKMTNGRTGFRWTAETGMQPLTPLGKFNNAAISTARGVSADGSIVVGESTVSDGWAAVVWREDGSVQTLPRHRTGENFTKAYAVSDNGRFVGGYGSGFDENNNSFQDPVLWDLITGDTLRLGDDSDPYIGGQVNDITDDGNIAIGSGLTIPLQSQHDFIWFRDRGLVTAKDYFKELGFDLDASPWGQVHFTSITPDGRYVTGWAYNPDGFTEGFVARIPAPPAAMLPALASLLAARRRSGGTPRPPFGSWLPRPTDPAPPPRC